MPEELLLRILAYLNTKTLISLQEVSEDINRLSKDRSLWNNFKCFLHKNNNYEDFISCYKEQYLEIKGYKFSDRKIKFLLKTLQPPKEYSHWTCCIEDHFYCMFFTYNPPYRVSYKNKVFSLVKRY